MKLIFLGKAALTKHNFALGYSTNEMNLHCTANDSKVKNRRARHLLVVRFRVINGYSYCSCFFSFFH